MFSRLKARMTYANVASTMAVVIAIGGGGAAVAAGTAPANSVASRQIVNNSVKSIDLKNGGVRGTDLANGAIDRASAFGTGLNAGIILIGAFCGAWLWNRYGVHTPFDPDAMRAGVATASGLLLLLVLAITKR